MKFYRNWYELAEGRDTDEKRLAFYDAIFRYAFDGVVPPKPVRGESPGTAWAAYDAFLTTAVIIDRDEELANSEEAYHNAKVEAGRKGGRAGKGVTRNVGNRNAVKKPLEEQNQKQTKGQDKSKSIAHTEANKTIAFKVKDKVKVEVKEKEHIRVRARDGGTDAEQEAEPEGSDRPLVVPTDEEIRHMASQVEVAAEYVPEFIAEMRTQGWGYVNRGGCFVQLNRRNCKAVVGSWYKQHLAIKRREAAGGRRNEPINIHHDPTVDVGDAF